MLSYLVKKVELLMNDGMLRGNEEGHGQIEGLK